MTWLLRTLLMCLLALALPLQGAVASTLRLCGPDQPLAQAASPDESASHARMDHAHHAGMADAGAATNPAASPADNPVDNKCSVCAACCLMAVTPSVPRLPEPSVALFRYRPQHLLLQVDFLPNGLERPPRTPLA
jgi:hypothetical protein